MDETALILLINKRMVQDREDGGIAMFRRFEWSWWIVGTSVAAMVVAASAWLSWRRPESGGGPADASGVANLERRGLASLEQGRIDEAERSWKEAEGRDPENLAVCLDLGRLAMRRGRWEQAAGYFERALKRSPLALEPIYNLSQAYRRLGRIDEAERYRRLADRQRRIQPPRRTGMGADFDPGAMGTPGPSPPR